jgi:NADPH-dependent 2,4-dienoyl-CoA reductase/sulfur reductase-like enzyme
MTYAGDGGPVGSPSPVGLLVVGGGPAGLSAAATAARHGVRTLLVDERPSLGGQIHRQPGPGFVVSDPARLGREYVRGLELIDDARRAGVELRNRTSVVALGRTSVVLFDETAGESTTLEPERVVLAPGAHDRPVVFPGWTLPGVLTAGGAQALLKASRVVPGDRVAFAGSGPLALAFPAQLRQYGVNVVLALEAGPAPGPRAVSRLLAAAAGNVALLRDGLRYRVQLASARVPVRYRRIVVRAEGAGRVEAVVHASVDDDWNVVARSEQAVAVDTLCVGYGFAPSSELFRLAGCAFSYDEDLGGPVVTVDSWQRTSVPGVLAAGDGSGVRGGSVAVDQGVLAGLAVALELGKLGEDAAQRLAAPVRRRLAHKERFRQALLEMYRVGGGLYRLTTPDTVVCRCEEVTRARLDEAIASTGDITVVKAYTRAGMGMCQGRNCQRQIAALIAERHRGVAAAGHGVARPLATLPAGSPALVPPDTARPPARPVPLGALADESIPDGGLFTRD